MAVGRARLLTSCAVVSLVASVSVVLGGAAHAADTSNCDSFTDDLFQVVNPRTGTSLVSRSRSEVSGATSYGFTEDHGVLAQVARSSEEGLTPVYRLYKSGDFAWAAHGRDVSELVAEGYSQQFVQFYASTNPVACLDAVERLERNGVHRLAAGSDVTALVQAGWRREKTAFYAVTADEPGTSPTTTPSPTPTSTRVPTPTPTSTRTSTPTATPTSTGPGQGEDTRFMIAVIPDTQNEVLRSTDTRMKNRSTWLADNKSALDLRYAVHTGDVVNWGHVAPDQFTKASADMKSLEAALPWAVSPGNHDTAAVCVGGSACPGANTSATVRDTTAFNRAFPVSRFGNVRGTFEPNKIDNAYATFRAGGANWMVLTLELWPRTGVVNWARDVVRTHADHNVVVATHAYLNADGSIGTSNGGYGANSPKYVFDNLIKSYPNIKIVLSGHTGQAAARTDLGTGGNKILSLLQTYHSPNTNPVRLVEIDTAAGTVSSRVYAPLTRTDYPADTTSTNGMSFVR